MISMAGNLPPSEEIKDETRAFFALLNLVTNPKASAERLEKLWKASAEAGEHIISAAAAQHQLSLDRAAHDKYLKESRAAHDAKLAAERKEVEAQCRRLDGESQNFSAKAKALLAKAKDDSEAAATLRADLEARLAKIREATA
jgi:hypothetical protein